MNVSVYDSTWNKDKVLQADEEWSMFKDLESPHGHNVVCPELPPSRAIHISYTSKYHHGYLRDLQLLVAKRIRLYSRPRRCCNNQ